MRFVKKNKYFIREGEPTGFFAGVIKGKVSVRKTHIFNKTTKEIEIKPLYKIVSVKKSPTIRKPHQKIRDDKNNDSFNKDDKNEIKSKLIRTNSKKKSNRNFNLSNDKINKSNNLLDRNYKIVKEHIDTDKYEFIEEELFIRGEGYCFGEWALIYKQPRAASIYTLEDCVFFTLDEVPFKNSFLKSLNYSEFNKKQFALKNFLPFNMSDDRQLSIYKNIVPITCKRGQIIFNEGDVADSIYLVYLGSFTLEKKYGYKQFCVLNLEKGSIIGLETIFEGAKSKYKCSLKLSNGFNCGIIFQLKTNKLTPYILNKMKLNFRTNYNLFLKSWKELYKKNIYVRETIINKLLDENNEEEKKEIFLDYMDDFELYDIILKVKKENKYEALFKKIKTIKDYENRKKDGSLRIYSSRQKSRIYDKEDEKNNKKLDNIDIIKYFKEFTKKPDYDRKNLKTAHQLRIRKLNNLNYNENFITCNNNKKLNNKKNKSLQSESITEKYEQNNEVNQKYSRTENEKNINIENKNIKNNDIMTNGSYKTITDLKLNVKLANNNQTKINDRYNRIGKQNEIIEFVDINKKIKKSNLILKNKNRIFKENIIKEKNRKILSEKIKFQLTKMNHSLKDSLYKKIDSQTIKNSKLKDSNFIYKMNILNCQNKSNFKNIFNFATNHIRTFKGNLSSTNSLISSRNNKIRLLLKNKDNIMKKNSLKKSSSQNQFNILTQKSHKNLQNKDNNKNKRTNLLLYRQQQQKQQERKLSSYNEINNFSGKYAKILKEFNLNNGFSFSYFKKINQINDFNEFELIKKRSKFPLSSNKFRVTFDSGDFNIPLVSSSINLLNSNKK